MTRREAPISPAVVLTIAGSDSGGGAGIQADLKTIEACGGFGTSAITSVTAQNTMGVQGSHLLPVDDIDAQIEAVLEDFDVGAVKTGMLATSEVVDLVTRRAADLPALVVDPVMVATSGDRLLAEEAEAAYERLVAESALVTPNADEAAVLTDVTVEDPASAERAGRVLVEDHGADAALVKGGHVPGAHVVDTLVAAADGRGPTITTFRHDRVETDATHGSGCTLSSAIATNLAHGDDLETAVGRGIDLLTRAVRYNVDVGQGPGAVHHLVELRNDASRAPTAELVELVADRIRDEYDETLVRSDGIRVAGATPHAEEPADVAAVAGRSSDHRAGDDGSRLPVRFGGDDALASLLLAAREADPTVGFGALVRCEAAALESLDGLTITAEGLGVHLDDTAPIPPERMAPFSAAERAPAAVSLPAGESGDGTARAVVFGETADGLLDALSLLTA